MQVSQSLKNGSVKRVRHSELWEDHAANLLDASNVKCLSVLLFCLLRLFSLTSLRLLCGPCWRSSVIRKQAEAQAWVKMGLSAEDAYEPIDVTTADGMIRVVTLPPAPVEAPVVLPCRHSALCRQSARHDRHSPGADVAAAYFGAQVDAILRLKHACAPLLKRLLQKREQGQREQEQRAAVEREAMEEVGTREYPCVTVSTRVTLAAVWGADGGGTSLLAARVLCARCVCARACVMFEGRRAHAARVNSSESAARRVQLEAQRHAEEAHAMATERQRQRNRREAEQRRAALDEARRIRAENCEHPGAQPPYDALTHVRTRRA